MSDEPNEVEICLGMANRLLDQANKISAASGLYKRAICRAEELILQAIISDTDNSYTTQIDEISNKIIGY